MAAVFDVSDIFERAVKTAVEAFVVALPSALVFTDLSSLESAAVAGGFAAATAAASVVLNAVLSWAQSEDTEVQL